LKATQAIPGTKTALAHSDKAKKGNGGEHYFPLCDILFYSEVIFLWIIHTKK
jgi:hypothetical protein